MFFTDTNGQLPTALSTALYMFGIVMEATPLDEIDFDAFKTVAAEIDSGELDSFC